MVGFLIRIRSNLGMWRLELDNNSNSNSDNELTYYDLQHELFMKYQIPIESQRLSFTMNGDIIIDNNNNNSNSSSSLNSLGITKGTLLYLQGRLKKERVATSRVVDGGHVVTAGTEIITM